MLNKSFVEIFLVIFILTISDRKCLSQPLNLKPVQPFVASSSLNSPKTMSRRYSVSANSDIRPLLINGIKSGSHPTIVAIPLYIRNNLSKFPSIFEVLSTNSYTQTESKSKDSPVVTSKGSDVLQKNALTDNPSNNSSLQKYSTQPLKPMKYNTREDQQKVVRQQTQQQTHETETNDPNELKSHFQWSFVVNNPNRHIDTNEKITLLRAPTQRYPSGETRKDPQTEYDSSNDMPTNKFNEMTNTEQNSYENSEYENEKPIKTSGESFNKNYHKSYPIPSVTDFDGNKGNSKSKGIDSHSSHSSGQTHQSYSIDDSSEQIDHNINVQMDNENMYHIQENAKRFPNDFQNGFIRSPVSVVSPKYLSPTSYSQSYDRSFHPNPYIQSSNTYITKPNGYKSNYETSYVTPYPQISSPTNPQSVPEDQSLLPLNHSPNLQSLANYNSRSLTPGTGTDPQKHSYITDQTIDQSPNNFNLNSQSISSHSSHYQNTDPKTYSVPQYSADYSTSEDNESNDDNIADYKSSHSQVFRTQNPKPEIETKTYERDNYETEDFDPTKLDLKIVHLPVSLLRRLIGSGDIGLPGFQ